MCDGRRRYDGGIWKEKKATRWVCAACRHELYPIQVTSGCQQRWAAVKAGRQAIAHRCSPTNSTNYRETLVSNARTDTCDRMTRVVDYAEEVTCAYVITAGSTDRMSPALAGRVVGTRRY